MNVDSFLKHHGLEANPFDAEEARHDPVFDRLAESSTRHPDFEKIVGRVEKPATSVVFGEKGSGKTAIRLLIGRRVAEHIAGQTERNALLVAYDEFNPYLDRLLRRQRGLDASPPTDEQIQRTLESLRLTDHQDAILSVAVTKVVDALLDTPRDAGESMVLPGDVKKRLRQLPRQVRADAAVLAALYDQPRGGSATQRFARLRQKLGLHRWFSAAAIGLLGTVLAVVGVGLMLARWMVDPQPWWLLPAIGITLAAAVVLWGLWGWRHVKLWLLCRRINKATRVLDRSAADLRRMLIELKADDLNGQPWPTPGDQDTRYQLTNRLLGVLQPLGYTGLLVLVDRVDEPSIVSGRPERMKPIVWPMLDNKFLQQSQVGLKLLLPIELRHLLHRESPTFFQEARLDKQNLVDRLEWSGTTLYDLCTARLRACAKATSESEPAKTLRDLFDDTVTRDLLIDALDQMHQPRDAFKFIYAVIQEHCRNTTEDEAVYHIPRLTLEGVRKTQSQRVQDLYRGLAPA